MNKNIILSILPFINIYIFDNNSIKPYYLNNIEKFENENNSGGIKQMIYKKH